MAAGTRPRASGTSRDVNWPMHRDSSPQIRQRTNRAELRRFVKDIAEWGHVPGTHDDQDPPDGRGEDSCQIVHHVDIALVPLGEELRAAVIRSLASSQVSAKHRERIADRKSVV